MVKAEDVRMTDSSRHRTGGVASVFLLTWLRSLLGSWMGNGLGSRLGTCGGDAGGWTRAAGREEGAAEGGREVKGAGSLGQARLTPPLWVGLSPGLGT